MVKLLISKQIVNFDMLYVVFWPSQFGKIIPQRAGNAISETLDFKIFRYTALLEGLDLFYKYLGKKPLTF